MHTSLVHTIEHQMSCTFIVFENKLNETYITYLHLLKQIIIDIKKKKEIDPNRNNKKYEKIMSALLYLSNTNDLVSVYVVTFIQ